MKQHLSDALVTRACTVDVAKISGQVLTALARTIILESVANTNTMLVKLARVRMEPLASITALDSLAYVHMDTQVK